jgi:hypothetical protein
MRLPIAARALCTVAVILSGCGGDGGTSNAACGKFTACGGDVVGNWTVDSVCFENLGSILADALKEPACAHVLRDSSVHATGTYGFNKDGTATTNLGVSIELDTLWSSACFSAVAGQSVVVDASVCAKLQSTYQQQGNFSKASCNFEAGGCACLLTSTDMSAMGSGAYQVQGKTLQDASGDSPFCVEPGAGTLRISITEAGLTGTILLKRK